MFARFCQAAAVPAALNKRSRLALRKLSLANCVRLIRTEIFRSFQKCACVYSWCLGMTVMNHLLMKSLRVFSEKVALSYLTAWREESLF